MTPLKSNQTDIKTPIGNYKQFFTDMRDRLKNLSIDITQMPLSHLNCRTTTVQEYEYLRDELRPFCSKFVETQFNGRPVSILVLKTPLTVSPAHAIPVIELPAPRPAHRYPSGLEHLGIVVGDGLPEFKKQYASVIMGEKDRRPYCFPAFITFENGTTAKFYERPLKEVIELQGWSFQRLV